MKKTKLTRSLLAACSIVALSAVMYGCTGDGSENDLTATQSDLERAEMERDAALAAQAAAEAAQATAEMERDAANAAAAAAAAAQATAEGERDAANAAAAAAAMAQATAEAAQAAAEMAQAEAEAAQAAAEMAQATAEAAQARAEMAQATAEAAQMVAEAATAVSERARMEAEAARTMADQERTAALLAQQAAEAEAEAAQMRADAAEAKAQAAEMRADAAEAAKTAAEAAQATAEARATAAETAKTAAEAAQATAEARATAAETARDAAIVERDAAIAERDRLKGDEEQTQAQIASDAAKDLLNMALVNPGDPGAGDIADTSTNDAEEAERVILRRRPMPMLSVSNDGMLMAEATGYSMGGADMIEGFRGATLTAMGDAISPDTAVIYSDIGNDGTVTLLNRYDSNLPMGSTTPRSWDIGADDNTDDLVEWSNVRRPNEMTTVGGPSDDPITMFEGSVHGISGTFTCNAAGDDLCVAPERYSDGKVNGATATLETFTWKFTPDDDSLTYTDDMDYVMFGWWLDYGEDGKPDHVRLITGATMNGDAATARTSTDTPGSIRGSATYTGAAAGKYAIASIADDTYEGGHFTATATLEVDFDVDLDGDTATTEDARTGIALSGTIDNFETYDGKDRSAWSVALMADGNGSAAAPGNTPNVMDPLANLVEDADVLLATSWSTGAAQSGTGTWKASWYGGTITSGSETAPTAVTGTFNAHIGTTTPDAGAVARMQGAFGANLQQ